MGENACQSECQNPRAHPPRPMDLIGIDMQTIIAYSARRSGGNRIFLGDGTMARTAIFAALFVGVAGFSGCMHEVKSNVQPDKGGGYVVLPENSNTWPYHYRDEAIKKIRETYVTFDPARDKVEEVDVPVGPASRSARRQHGTSDLLTHDPAQSQKRTPGLTH